MGRTKNKENLLSKITAFLKRIFIEPFENPIFVKIFISLLTFVFSQFIFYFGVPGLIERTSEISIILRELPRIMFSIPTLPSTLLLSSFEYNMTPLSALKILELMVRAIGFIMSVTGAIAVYILKKIKTSGKRIVGIIVVVMVLMIFLSTIFSCLTSISTINTESQTLVESLVLERPINGLIWGVFFFGLLIVICPIFL